MVNTLYGNKMASSLSSTTENSTSYWIKFFTDAGIPAGDSANYAVAFNDNRIQKNMLLDLSKEYLLDMGIARLGDVIAILKHAKAVHTQDARDKVLKTAVPGGSTVQAAGSPSQPKRSTAASRMVDHYMRKDPGSAPMKQVVIVKPDLPDSKRSSVFERLGSDSPQQVTVTGLGNVVLRGTSPSSSVFQRLGDKSTVKRAASSTSVLGEEEDSDSSSEMPLAYAGVLKSPPKKIKLSTAKSKKASEIKAAAHKLAMKKKITIQTAEVTTTSPTTAGILSMDLPMESLSVKQRLGKKVIAEAASSTTSLPTSTTKPTVTVRLGPQKSPTSVKVDSGVKSRLGPKVGETPTPKPVTKTTTAKVSNVSTSVGVFSRLGKKHPS